MIITFMSDFGTKDGYSAAVKGIIKSYSAASEIIDITHDIPVYDIHKAAFTLVTYYRTFPAGTVHLCVIDPGVGSALRGIIGVTESYYFVGPDNGLFDFVRCKEEMNFFEIETENYKKISSVFHGRDIFAPVAAQLANGVKPQLLGAKTKIDGPFQTSSFKKQGGAISVRPAVIDNFGNIVFRIMEEELKSYKITKLQFKNFTFHNILRFYNQAKEQTALCLWNSMGFLEIAVNRGNAADIAQVDLTKDELHITVEKI